MNQVVVSSTNGTESVVVNALDNDYVKNGVFYRHSYITSSVMVESSSDLTGLADLVEPGTVAYTAGFANMWQLKADKTWASIVSES